MDRGLQFELVDKLTQICTANHIDPDKMEELLAIFDNIDFDPGTPGHEFVDAILDFFSTHMKMQEWIATIFHKIFQYSKTIHAEDLPQPKSLKKLE